MNALQMARTAYSSAAAPVRSDRGTEYETFAKITHRLRTADATKDYVGFVGALHENKRLWNILAVDVADSGNQLTNSLRAQIFYLAEFTAKHTSDILNRRAEVDVLIDINTAIMSGLGQVRAPT